MMMGNRDWLFQSDVLKPKAVGATFHYFARKILKTEPEVLE